MDNQQKIQKAMEQDPNLRKACRIWNTRGGEKYYREVKDKGSIKEGVPGHP